MAHPYYWRRARPLGTLGVAHPRRPQVPRFSSSDNHDPWWDLDGPTARRERQRERVVTILAFLASLAAFLGAALVWAVRLGLGRAVGAA